VYSRAPSQKPKKKRKEKKMGPLSFDLDGETDDVDGFGESDAPKKKKLKKIMKDPNVETDFLPDRERERQEELERQRLRQEWEAEQERIKSESGGGRGGSVSQPRPANLFTSLVFADEDVSVTYSYWDGSGHRREITVREITIIERGDRGCDE
jgi:protein FAM50